MGRPDDERAAGARAREHRPRARALDAHELADLVATTVPQVREGRWRVVQTVLVGARKQRGKQILEALLSYDDLAQAGRSGSVRLVVKLYGSDRGAPSLAALTLLRDAGFAPPAPSRVPEPFGYAPERGALLQEHVTGGLWADLLTASPDERARGARCAADWLLALQRLGPTGRAAPVGEGAAQVARWSQELAADFPAAAARVAELAGRVGPLLAESAATTAAHGDLHPKNVFLDGVGATVIDFDTFGDREPAFDVGYAIGQLLVMSWFRCGGPAPGAAAAAAFWRRYASGGGAARWQRVRVQVVRTLVQSLHYELCTLRNGRVELLERWPALADELLRDEAVVPGEAAPHVDPTASFLRGALVP